MDGNICDVYKNKDDQHHKNAYEFNVGMIKCESKASDCVAESESMSFEERVVYIQ